MSFRTSICWVTSALAVSVAFACLPSTARADLLGYWPIAEGSGDLTANALNPDAPGLISNLNNGLGPDGSVWIDDAERGIVLSFDGTAEGAYVQAGEIPQMTLENDFTWSFWANQDAGNTTPNDIILGNRRNVDMADFNPRQFIKFTPTKFEYHMNGNGNDNLEYEDIPADEWIYHVVVKDGAELTYYRNGEEGDTKTITQALDVPQPLFFGGDNTGSGGENWRGMIDDVSIWDEALDAETIAAIADGAGILEPPGDPGDFNLDGVVDVADFMIMAENFNAKFALEDSFSKGDFDLNTRVNLKDFIGFREVFNGQQVLAAVPEPSTFVTALLALAVVGAVGHRRTSTRMRKCSSVTS